MIHSRLFADGRLDCRAEARIGRLLIDRPMRKNALDHAMWLALPDAVAWLAGEAGARVILVSGAGGDFSAGADIGEFDLVRKDTETALAYERANSAGFRALRESPVPVIAEIRGVCFGGAFGLAAACDLRLADRTARFAVPAARLGLAYPADAVADLVHAVGSQRARHLLISTEEMDAATALACGFLLECLDPVALAERTGELARRIADAAPLSVAASRATVDAVLSGDGGAMASAVARGAATFESEDYAEGRKAFRERRRPVFKGR